MDPLLEGTAERCKHLPDECWELIFNKLGHHSHFQALILVCKRFFSIIRHLHTTLNLTLPAVTFHRDNISNILTNFPKINSISLHAFDGSKSILLNQINISAINLESLDISGGILNAIGNDVLLQLGQKMKCLKILKCSNMLGVTDGWLASVAYCLRKIEVLEINNPRYFFDRNRSYYGDIFVTDHGIEMISLYLKKLRKIDVSGHQFLTDKSLTALSTNCGLLEEVAVRACTMITVNGIQILLKNSPNLKSLLVSHIHLKTPSLNLYIQDAFTCAKQLSILDISNSRVRDEFLYSLAVSGIPLKRFSLSNCDSFSCDGIAFLLEKYHFLEYLSLINVNFLDDSFFAEFSSSLCMLTTLKLKMCNLTESTFFMLSESCPLLENVYISNTNIGKGDKSVGFAKNSRIKSLSLSCSQYLSDECLAKFALICPSLEKLDVSYCPSITENGVSNFLNRCSNIRHLEINGCREIKSIGQGNELPQLEVLRAAKSGINDEGLVITGKRCCNLLKLDMEGCLGVTTNGLMDMLKKYKRIREINLNECTNVSVAIIDWMVFSTPSLRKIVPPCPLFPDLMDIYLRHGCCVWTPPKDNKSNNKRYC